MTVNYIYYTLMCVFFDIGVSLVCQKKLEMTFLKGVSLHGCCLRIPLKTLKNSERRSEMSPFAVAPNVHALWIGVVQFVQS